MENHVGGLYFGDETQEGDLGVTDQTDRLKASNNIYTWYTDPMCSGYRISAMQKRSILAGRSIENLTLASSRTKLLAGTFSYVSIGLNKKLPKWSE